MTGNVCVVGALNLDWVARVAGLPRAGETVMASGLSRHAGGKGLNQAVAAARAGAAVRLLGRTGRDEAGDWLLRFAEATGVDVAAVARDSASPTGQAFITVSDGGENCIVVAAAANLQLTPADASPTAVAGARVLLAQLETATEPVAALFAADLPGCLKVLNAAPALSEGVAIFADCDLLIVNETELAAYAGLVTAPADIATAARGLLSRAGQSVVVTLGAQGALIVEADDGVHVPAHPAQAIDTVGAGDCFCGVLAAGLADGLALRDAVDRANAAAALAVTRRGAAEAMPSRAEINAAWTSSTSGRTERPGA